MTGIPQAAIDAAQAYDHAHRPVGRGYWARVPDHQVARLLAGAAPHIAAAERERIRQLATQHDARCPAMTSAGGILQPLTFVPFADLLTDPKEIHDEQPA